MNLSESSLELFFDGGRKGWAFSRSELETSIYISKYLDYSRPTSLLAPFANRRRTLCKSTTELSHSVDFCGPPDGTEFSGHFSTWLAAAVIRRALEVCKAGLCACSPASIHIIYSSDFGLLEMVASGWMGGARSFAVEELEKGPKGGDAGRYDCYIEFETGISLSNIERDIVVETLTCPIS